MTARLGVLGCHPLQQGVNKLQSGTTQLLPLMQADPSKLLSKHSLSSSLPCGKHQDRQLQGTKAASLLLH